MKIGKKILEIFLNIIMVIVFLIAIISAYSFFQVNILKNDYSNIFGYTIFRVKTGSMEPTLKIGDILIEKVVNSKDEIKKDDIISFKEEDYIVTHRVVDIKEDLIIAQGDANNSQDEPFSRDKIIGKVIKVIPDLSIWIKVFKTKEVYITIIITIVLFIITFSINVEDLEEGHKKTKERKIENTKGFNPEKDKTDGGENEKEE